MAHYRCYFFDTHRHVIERAAADHPSLEAAIAWGHRLSRDHKSCETIEIWSGDQLLHQEPCSAAAAE